MSDWNKLESTNNLLEVIAGHASDISSNTGGGGAVNITQIDSNAVEVNSGNKNAGTLRVCIASDDILMTRTADNTALLYNLISTVDNYIDINNPISAVSFLFTDQRKMLGNTISVNSGNQSSGTQRVCVATDDINLSAVNTSTTAIAGCVDVMNNLVRTNISAINDEVPTMNSGTLTAGTQRVCVATDDVNLSAINTATTNISSIATSNQSGIFPAQKVVLAGVTFGAGEEPISTGAGTQDGGTVRMTLATDDTALSQVNAHLATIETKLTNIYDLLFDVWDNAANKLRVGII